MPKIKNGLKLRSYSKSITHFPIVSYIIFCVYMKFPIEQPG